jgi:hypothetical protein
MTPCRRMARTALGCRSVRTSACPRFAANGGSRNDSPLPVRLSRRWRPCIAAVMGVGRLSRLVWRCVRLACFTVRMFSFFQSPVSAAPRIA